MALVRFAVLAGCLLLAAGCLSVTPRGLIEAARFDPMTANPADLSPGLGVPESIRLADGDAMIVITYQVAGEAGPRVNERFLLEIADAGSRPDAPKPRPGERIYLGRLSDLDALRMKDVQSRILALKAEGVGGKGSFSIGLHGGCSTQLPLTALPFRTFIRFRPGTPHVEMTRQADLLALLPADERARLATAVQPCTGREPAGKS